MTGGALAPVVDCIAPRPTGLDRGLTNAPRRRAGRARIGTALTVEPVSRDELYGLLFTGRTPNLSFTDFLFTSSR